MEALGANYNGEPVEASQPTVKYVVKRDGTHETLNFDKLRARFENKSYGLNMDYINFEVLVAKLESGIYQGKNMFQLIPHGFSILNSQVY